MGDRRHGLLVKLGIARATAVARQGSPQADARGHVDGATAAHAYHAVATRRAERRDAVKNLDKCMEGTLGDWVIVSITETNIMDVYRYKQVAK